MDLDTSINFDEFEIALQNKEKDLHIRKEITSWNENTYLWKNHTSLSEPLKPIYRFTVVVIIRDHL